MTRGDGGAMGGAAGSRATLYVGLGAALNGVAAFGFQIVATRALGAVDYAPISVVWTLQYLWIAVAVTAVEAYVTRSVTVSGGASATVHRFTRLLGRWLAATAVVTALAAWLLRGPLFGGAGTYAVVLGLVVFGYGVYGVVRGRAAGMERFAAYGLATMGESVLRFGFVVVVLAVVVDPRAVAATFPLGPLLVAAFAWWRLHPTAWTTGPAEATAPPVERGRARRFLFATSGANAAVQFLLAGGPIVLVPLGASAATVSVFFTTATTARVPLTFALNGGLSRVLPPLTRMARDDDRAGLRRAAVGILAGFTAAAALAAAVAWFAGPWVLEALFGADFRPTSALVATIAVATVLGFGGLLLDQLYIAMGRERMLPVVWAAAVVVAGVLVAVLPGAAELRVATAFAAATALAVAALGVPLLRRG